MTTEKPAEAQEITRASKSNLALAFIALPRERREDISVFYAFCRVIDDIADDPGQSIDERRSGLNRWKEALFQPAAGEPTLAPAIRKLIAKYRLRENYFLEIIAGVEMDLTGATFETFNDLRLYCYRVASVVGLISIEIFGYEDPGCKRYAVELGMALQLTNILRDVGEDFANGGRVYLPREDLARFGYTAEDLAARRHNAAFLQLMKFESERALSFFASAQAELPPQDRRSMIAAEIMGAIYRRLLDRMIRDEFHVFGQRYRLSSLEKLMTIASTFIRNRFASSRSRGSQSEAE
jgi:phytoene synthase